MTLLITAADDCRLITGDATGEALTASLLSADTAAPGFSVTIKKTGTGYNTFTITPETGTIDGEDSFVLRLPGQSVRLVSDGTTWHVADRSGEEIYGSNANGKYLRKASGIQECWSPAVGNGDANSASGAVFRGTADTVWTFPMPFSEAPVVTASADIQQARWAEAGAVTATEAAIRQFAAVGTPAGVNTRARAIGDWF